MTIFASAHDVAPPPPLLAVPSLGTTNDVGGTAATATATATASVA